MAAKKIMKINPLNHQQQAASSFPTFRRSLLAAAIVACHTPVFAQDSENQNDDEEAIVEEVRVTGQRTSIESAIELKRNSDTIGDSIVLDEAGKVPSTSLLEILERTPGVTMNRIRAGSQGSPDGFSFEGSGVQVRGLTATKTLLNGREVYSATGGSGLSWADVGPELLKAVTVYKASRADLIEGGLGGTTNLETHMPFDFEGFTFHGALSGSYGDFSEAVTPAGSALIANTFDTSIGELGVLVDFAYSKIESYDSNVLIAPYYASDYQGERVYVPGGVRFTDDKFERTRKGYYGALQWQPNDNLEIYHTTFISERESDRDTMLMALGTTTTPAALEGSQFENGVFVRGGLGNPGNASIPVASESSFRPAFSKTSDFSTGFKYQGDGWDISGSYQYVKVRSHTQKNGFAFSSMSGETGISRTDLDLTGSLPSTRFVDPLTTDATEIGASKLTWLTQEAEGSTRAAQLDASFDIGDGFFKKAAGGVRVAKREESASFVGTWWSATGRNWNGVPRVTADAAPAGDVQLYEFPNFFKDDIQVPGFAYMPTHGANQPDQYERIMNTYAACGPDLPFQCSDPAQSNYIYGNPPDPTFGNVPEMSTTKPETESAYVMFGFGNDSANPWLNFSGNIGLRWVNYEVESLGNFVFKGGSEFFPNMAAAQGFVESIGGIGNLDAWREANPDTQVPGVYESIGSTSERQGFFSDDYLLPSFNIKFEPIENWVFRYAITKAFTPPNYADIRAQGTNEIESVEVHSSLPPVLTGYDYVSGNTLLKPEVSINNDISLEWYPRKGTSVHLSLFHKSIEDKVVFNNFTAAADEFFADEDLPISRSKDTGEEAYIPGSIIGRGNINAEETTTISGLELGGRTYFDQLPGWLSGFGIDANFTFIENDSPDSLALDMNGDPLSVPLIGLSDFSYSTTLLYDRDKLSARLAWTWRDRYLTTTNDSSTTNSYSDPYTGDGISFALPLYAAASGRLDGSISYSISDDLNIKLSVQNILNEVAETEMEILDDVYVNRGWFMTDRRVSLHLGYEF